MNAAVHRGGVDIHGGCRTILLQGPKAGRDQQQAQNEKRGRQCLRHTRKGNGAVDKQRDDGGEDGKPETGEPARRLVKRRQPS